VYDSFSCFGSLIYNDSFAGCGSLSQNDSFALSGSLSYIDSFGPDGSLVSNDSFRSFGSLTCDDSFDSVGSLLVIDSYLLGHFLWSHQRCWPKVCMPHVCNGVGQGRCLLVVVSVSHIMPMGQEQLHRIPLGPRMNVTIW